MGGENKTKEAEKGPESEVAVVYESETHTGCAAKTSLFLASIVPRYAETNTQSV